MLIVEGWGKSLWDILSLCDNLSLTLYINIKKRYQGILHSNTRTCLPIWVFWWMILSISMSVKIVLQWTYHFKDQVFMISNKYETTAYTIVLSIIIKFTKHLVKQYFVLIYMYWLNFWIWRSQSETNLFAGGSPPQEISGELPKNTTHLVKPCPDNRRISTGSMPIYETRLPKLTQESFGRGDLSSPVLD